jgi:hypothetical protein
MLERQSDNSRVCVRFLQRVQLVEQAWGKPQYISKEESISLCHPWLCHPERSEG